MTTILDDIVFPSDIAATARVELMRRADRAETRSGRSFPSAVWSRSKRRYIVSYGPNRPADAAAIVDLYEAVGGVSNGFLFEDFRDYSSNGMRGTPTATDQDIGTGDGSQAAFQLRKGYTRGSTTHWRKITRPQSGTVLVAVDGVTKSSGTHYTIDLTTGVVTFTAGNIPTSGQSVTAGFKFHVPVEFDADSVGFDVIAHETDVFSDIVLLEVFE